MKKKYLTGILMFLFSITVLSAADGAINSSVYSFGDTIHSVKNNSANMRLRFFNTTTAPELIGEDEDGDAYRDRFVEIIPVFNYVSKGIDSFRLYQAALGFNFGYIEENLKKDKILNPWIDIYRSDYNYTNWVNFGLTYSSHRVKQRGKLVDSGFGLKVGFGWNTDDSYSDDSYYDEYSYNDPLTSVLEAVANSLSGNFGLSWDLNFYLKKLYISAGLGYNMQLGMNGADSLMFTHDLSLGFSGTISITKNLFITAYISEAVSLLWMDIFEGTIDAMVFGSQIQDITGSSYSYDDSGYIGEPLYTTNMGISAGIYLGRSIFLESGFQYILPWYDALSSIETSDYNRWEVSVGATFKF